MVSVNGNGNGNKNGVGLHRLTGAARLRVMLQKEEIVVAPGVYDGYTARLAMLAGFDILYMTGAGTSMSRLGMADLGLTTMDDMVRNAGMIAGLDRKVPLIADADTGYGGPLMVRRTVEAYIRAGVASFHIEDQVQTKRCGHLASKELVDEEVYISRIKAAVLTREEYEDIVIIARTDSLQSLGYEAAVARLKTAVAARADVAFLEALTSMEQVRVVVHDLAPTPVLLNMAPHGVTPDLTAEEAQELGFKIIIFPSMALAPVYEAVYETAKALKETGTVKLTKVMQIDPKQAFEVCGLEELMEFDKASGGAAFKGGV
jgi:2-methylisocitrate lyase-like PEP mutase family enzyme